MLKGISYSYCELPKFELLSLDRLTIDILIFFIIIFDVFHFGPAKWCHLEPFFISNSYKLVNKTAAQTLLDLLKVIKAPYKNKEQYEVFGSTFSIISR